MVSCRRVFNAGAMVLYAITACALANEALMPSAMASSRVLNRRQRVRLANCDCAPSQRKARMAWLLLPDWNIVKWCVQSVDLSRRLMAFPSVMPSLVKLMRW